MRARSIVIAFLFGCGGGSSGVDVHVDQSNVCDQIAEVACHNMYQCCTEGEIESRLHVTDPRTESECSDDMIRSCERSKARLDFAVDQGRVRFDAASMNRCLEALVAPSDSCATVASAPPWTDACMDKAWVGLVDNGGSCLSSLECASPDSDCSASHICVARPGNGQPCPILTCASGLFCSVGTCHPQLDAGAACSVFITTECREGLFCDGTTVSAVCAPLHGVGETCTGNQSCTSKQCNPGTCSDTGFTCSSNTTCLPAGTCVGNVCSEVQNVADYCTGAFTALPIPNPGQAGAGAGLSEP